jgi:hypothetical protein
VFGDSPSYRKLVDPHSKVHSYVHDMVRLLDSNWERDSTVQDKIFDALSAAEQASLGVMQVIDQVVADKHPEVAKQN